MSETGSSMKARLENLIFKAAQEANDKSWNPKVEVSKFEIRDLVLDHCIGEIEALETEDEINGALKKLEQEIARPAAEMAQALNWSVLTPKNKENKQRAMGWEWLHLTGFDNAAARNVSPEFSRDTIEEVVSFYLQQPWRNQKFDRKLTDILMACSITEFTQHALKPMGAVRNPMWSWLPNPKNSVLEWLLSRVLEGLLLGLLWLPFLWLQRMEILEETIFSGISIFLFVLWAYSAISSLLSLPSRLIHQLRWRRKATNLYLEMLTAYDTLNSVGVVSVKRLRTCVDNSDPMIFWAPTLYSLLEDIESRTDRLPETFQDYSFGMG